MKKKSLSAKLIFISSILALALISEIIISSKVRALKAEFPRLQSDEKLNSRVQGIYTPKFIRKSEGTVFVRLQDRNAEINTFNHLVPYDKELDDLLQIGDSVVKNRENDTILIYDGNTNELEYKYVLRPKN